MSDSLMIDIQAVAGSEEKASWIGWSRPEASSGSRRKSAVLLLPEKSLPLVALDGENVEFIITLR